MSEDLTKDKVLVVEDEEVSAEVIEEFFRIHSCDCVIAKDGIKARELLKKNKYPLILTDIFFYWSGGIDLIKTIREKDTTTPIVAITGYGSEVANEALEAGANDVLLKPFDVIQLKKIIGKFVDLKEVELVESERRFGITAVEKEFITPEKLIEAINIQIMEDVEKGSHRPVGRILLDLGHMTIQQIDDVLKILGKIPEVK